MPVTVTSQVEEMLGEGLELVRTPASLPELTKAAAERGGRLRRGDGRRLRLPRVPARLRRVGLAVQAARAAGAARRPLSEVVAELPQPTLIHRSVQCPWALKGAVMRVLNERFADADVDLTDGIKVFEERGWVQVLPDPDEPLIHVYAEGGLRRGVRAAGRTSCARSWRRRSTAEPTRHGTSANLK